MSQPNIPVPVGVLNDVVSFIEVSSLATKQAMDEVQVRRQAYEKAAALANPLLEKMIAKKVVAPGQKEAALAMLGGHDTSLGLLDAAVDKIAELQAALAGGSKQAGDLGKGVDSSELGVSGSAAGGAYEKIGAYNSLTHPVVGEKTANLKESDKPLLRLVGKG